MKFKGFSDWIEIFRGGRQIDSNGVTHDGDSLIAKALAGFNPSVHEPPIVVGHPKDNSPAFGWVEALKSGFKDGVQILYAKVKDVVPEFAQGVAQGLWKKRSASFYPDGTLRHVGFLGAAPPAVKGLADLKFADEGETTFEFAAPDAAKQAQQARAKKYNISIKPDGHVTKPGQWTQVPDDRFLDPVNYRYPCPDAPQTRSAASYWGVAKNQAEYTPAERAVIAARLNKFRKEFKIGNFNQGGNEMKGFKEKLKRVLNFLGMDMEKIPEDAFPEELPEGDGPGGDFTAADLETIRKKAREDERKKVEAEFAEKDRRKAKSARDKEISDWVALQVKEGKIMPAWAGSGLAGFMQGLDADTEIAFAEGSEKKSQLDYFKGLLDDLGKFPLFTEMAKKQNAGEPAEFAQAKKEQELGEKIAAKVTKSQS